MFPNVTLQILIILLRNIIFFILYYYIYILLYYYIYILLYYYIYILLYYYIPVSFDTLCLFIWKSFGEQPNKVTETSTEMDIPGADIYQLGYTKN
jgi:hypothetical protein